MKVLVTGGAGFVGSHVAEFYAEKGEDVVVLDNLTRAKLLGKDDKNASYNWEYLKKFDNISLIKGDIRDKETLTDAADGCDVIIHTAGQTAVTTSVVDPEPDFTVNAYGTFNVLEVARKSSRKPTIIYCSTNKVYGENVNLVQVQEEQTRYVFKEKKGIDECFDIDLCEHTPYGCSKLTGDLYMQDYAHQYGLKTGVFRMSCIYGPRQFGFEDQGWVAWFTIATLLGKPITIFGDGKQVRDVLFVSDLVAAFDDFIKSDIPHVVNNIGGGGGYTMSLLELLDILQQETGSKSAVQYQQWRPSDQKVYISDISRIKQELGWEPKISPSQGVKKLIDWVKSDLDIFR